MKKDAAFDSPVSQPIDASSIDASSMPSSVDLKQTIPIGPCVYSQVDSTFLRDPRNPPRRVNK